MEFNATKTGYDRVVAQGRAYYYRDGSFYRTSFRNGDFTYVVITAPLGAEIDSLPANCSEFVKDGTAYVRCGDTFYEKVFDGEAVRYRVVPEP